MTDIGWHSNLLLDLSALLQNCPPLLGCAFCSVVLSPLPRMRRSAVSLQRQAPHANRHLVESGMDWIASTGVRAGGGGDPLPRDGEQGGERHTWNEGGRMRESERGSEGTREGGRDGGGGWISAPIRSLFLYD